MRVKHAVLFLSVLVSIAFPFFAHASSQEPIFLGAELFGIPRTNVNGFGEPQTALKAGDTPRFRITVASEYYIDPTVSIDFSQLGMGSSTIETAYAKTNERYLHFGQYTYIYDFGPFTLGADISDGEKEIPIVITSSSTPPVTTSATMKVTVDNAPPTISLSKLSFSPTPLSDSGFTIYLSGSIDETGSIAYVPWFSAYYLKSDGNKIPNAEFGGGMPIEINSAIASSTDGSFSNVAIFTRNFDTRFSIADAAAIRVEMIAADGAGLIATTSVTAVIPPPDPCATPGACASNVLFLPGIMGSRLYEGTGCGKSAEEKLWEPAGEALLKVRPGIGDDKVRGLFLDSSGASECADVYVKKGGVIDSATPAIPFFPNQVYESFIDQMDGLESAGTINDWEPVAYDWRLSFNDLLSKGTERGGKVYYTEATSTPYVEQTLRALAVSSKTGKVTIVAHSNGGLLAKALLNKLADESGSLVDKVVMVGAPQSGTPASLGALLYGYDQGLSFLGFPILHSSVAQDLAENSPTAYHLLPSADYFESIAGDVSHPIARFAGDGYAAERAAYGETIDDTAELGAYLRSLSMNSGLIDYADETHESLDSWAPPDGIKVTQIAGWGVDTVAGIDYYTAPATDAITALSPARVYRPSQTEDGDGTVTAPSALMMASSTSVSRYWVDLGAYYRDTRIKRTHKDLFEIPQLEDFIKNIITNSTSSPPTYISTEQPASLTSDKKLIFTLHSPLTLELTDLLGNTTGLSEDEEVNENIPGSTYGEFGDVKYVIVPEGSYSLAMHGWASGTFSLDIQESSGGVITASTTIANVPTATTTLVSLTISGGLETVSPMSIDQNGDGANVTLITPTIGETVVYTPPAPSAPVLVSPVSHGGGGSGGAISVPVIATSTIRAEMAATSSLITATQTPTIIEPEATTTDKQRITAPIAYKSTTKASATKVSVSKASQPASVYGASQQLFVKRLVGTVYNGIQSFWIALKRLF